MVSGKLSAGLAPAVFAAALAALPAAAQTHSMADRPVPAASTGSAITGADFYHLRSAGNPQLSPDGSQLLYTVQYADRAGNPYTRLWHMRLTDGRSSPWGSADGVESSLARWSPDGRQVAYTAAGKLMVAAADGSNARAVADFDGTNDPMSRVGERIAWSPDSKRIAFVSAVASTELPMEADPIVITRYWFRPAHGYPSRFNDDKRLHLFLADLATGKVEQLTKGDAYEHSVDWSPDGRKLLYVTNPEPNQDQKFQYDLFTMDMATRKVARLTNTRGIEYAPSWSPDGKSIAFSGLMRNVTSSESNMEDPHAWVLDVASGARREVGSVVDAAQSRPQWSRDGKSLYFTGQFRGSVGLFRVPAAGGAAERIGPSEAARGSVSAFAVASSGQIVAAMATPVDSAQLYRLTPGGGASALTSLNKDLLGRKTVAKVEAFTFKSFDDREIEAFITYPASFDPKARGRYPMILTIHGGPHGQQGPAFNAKAQAYAAKGWAVLAVNYRGSTGYGQSFGNLIARDQDGGEGMDVLAGVDAAIKRYPWIDADRMGIEGGSYGGQLTNWLITQTPRFKAAIPWAGISNIVSHNYMSAYHDYLEQEYFGKPHTGGIADMLWTRSPIRFVQNVKTPTMLSHGDNDLLVNPAEDEQYFIALKDAGVEAVMLRYPREGHGMRETGHVVDFLNRSIDWYQRHFDAVK